MSINILFTISLAIVLLLAVGLLVLYQRMISERIHHAQELLVVQEQKSKDIAKSNLAFFHAIWDREVRIYSGVKGMQMAFMELLEDTKEFIGFGYSKKLSDVYTAEFSDKWHIERIKKRIPCKIFAFDDKETRAYYEPRVKAKEDFYVKYLPKELQGPTCITLSDKMVATFVYTEKKFMVVVNKNKETVGY